MASTVRCPSCTTVLKVPENFQGRAVRCGRCQTIVPVALAQTDYVASAPKPGPPPGEVSPITTLDVADFVVSAPNPAPPPREEIEELPELVPLSAREARESGGRPKKRPVEPAEPALRKQKPRRRSSLPVGWVIGGLAGIGVLGVVVIGLIAWLVSRGLHPSAPVIPAEQWQAFEVPNRVKALLPGPAKRTAQPSAGLTLVMHMYEPDKNSIYAIGYSEGQLPPHRLQVGPEVLLKDACDGSTANLRAQGGEEISRQSVQLGPYPGKELIHRISKANGKMITRTYLAHGRLYMVMAGGVRLDADHENVKRLFDSFQIIETPAPQPVGPGNTRPGNNPPVAQRQEPPRPQGPPADSLAEIVLPPNTGTVLGVAYSPDGRTLVVATSTRQVLWYDTSSRALQVRTPERKDRAGGPPVHGCAIAPQADKVAFLYPGGQLLIERGNLAGETVLSAGQANGLAQSKGAFSPDGRFLATDYGHSVRVWDVAGRKMVRELTTFRDLIGSVAFAPDGSLLAGADPDVHLFDPKTYQELTKLKGPGPFMFPALAFSLDNKMLAGGNDTSVFVWTLERKAGGVTLADPHVFRYLTGHVIAVAFSSGSRLVVAAGDDGQIKYWNVENGQSRGVVNLREAGIGAASSLAVRANDRYLQQLAAGCGNRVLFFALPGFKDDR